MHTVDPNLARHWINLSQTVDYKRWKFYRTRPKNQRATGWQNVKENRGTPCICRNMIIREFLRRGHAKNSGIHRTYPSQFRQEELGDFHKNRLNWGLGHFPIEVDRRRQCRGHMQRRDIPTSCAAFAESLCASNVFDDITQKSTIICMTTEVHKLL